MTLLDCLSDWSHRAKNILMKHSADDLARINLQDVQDQLNEFKLDEYQPQSIKFSDEKYQHTGEMLHRRFQGTKNDNDLKNDLEIFLGKFYDFIEKHKNFLPDPTNNFSQLVNIAYLAWDFIAQKRMGAEDNPHNTGTIRTVKTRVSPYIKARFYGLTPEDLKSFEFSLAHNGIQNVVLLPLEKDHYLKKTVGQIVWAYVKKAI